MGALERSPLRGRNAGWDPFGVRTARTKRKAVGALAAVNPYGVARSLGSLA